jgi:hypothetical protein
MKDHEHESRREFLRSKVDNLHNIWRSKARPRTAHSLQSEGNWLLAISAGSFLLLFNSMNQFVVAGVIPMKSLYLLSIALVFLSTLFFALSQRLLLRRQVYFDHVLESLEECRRTLEKQAAEPKPLPEAVSGEALRDYQLVISISEWLVRSGFVSYCLGIGFGALYMFIFVVRYL